MQEMFMLFFLSFVLHSLVSSSCDDDDDDDWMMGQIEKERSLLISRWIELGNKRDVMMDENLNSTKSR
jgi:hypothetical protein